jgi:cobalt-zinc-cadmium efflux system protein
MTGREPQNPKPEPPSSPSPKVRPVADQNSGRSHEHSPDHGHGHGHGHDHDRDHDHDHDHDHAPHSHDFRQASRRALTLAGLLLATIFVVELVGGWIAGSLALLADAGHLLTDVAAVGLALLAQWFGKRPACATKSFGFRRVEILAAQLNGVSLWAIALVILYEAVTRLQDPPQVASTTMVLIATGGLVVQTVAALVLARAAGESLNVKGAYVHAATDAVQSAGVVITGLVMMFTGWWILDPLVSIAIALLIAWSGGKIVWEATHVLMEGTPSGVDLLEIAEAIHGIEGVTRVTDLHAWSITTGYNALSAHVETQPELSAEQREDLREELTHRLQRHFPLHHLTLQVETTCLLCRDGECTEWLAPPAAEEGTP